MYALETLTVDRAVARMRAPETRELFSYWDRIRGMEEAPDRRDLEPFDISACLGDILLVDTDHASNMIRLVGSRIATNMVRDLRGQSFDMLWTPRDRPRVRELLDYAIACPSGIQFDFTMLTASGRSAAMEGLLLPMRFGGPNIRRLIGIFTPMEQPWWVGAEAVNDLVLDRAAIFPTTPQNALTPRFARSHPIFADATPRRRVRHLALYDGGLK
ncbi:PAS domain-containing protein [Tepidamorphus sp. 3E244]|uniref:PAS domain-containing protein n=1 Tax=Tepidamorphus sp. 3E244 TaxID=3385498 RepID=UPI0038FC03BC